MQGNPKGLPCFLVEKPILQIKVHKNKSFGQAFSKACGVKGQSPCRDSQIAKFFILTKDQEGREHLSRGSPKKFDFVQSDNSGKIFSTELGVTEHFGSAFLLIYVAIYW